MPSRIDVDVVLDVIETLTHGRSVTVPRPWGVMKETIGTHLTVKIITVGEGHRTSLHYHKIKNEAILIVGGSGYVELGSHFTDASLASKELVKVIPTKWLRIRAGRLHRMIGPLTFVEVSTTDVGNKDTYRMADDYGRANRVETVP